VSAQSGRQKSIQEITVEVGMLVGCIHSILHKDLNMLFLLHDNAPAAPCQVTALENVSYSLDLSQADMFPLSAT
jgi:hypothetical protein